VKPRRISLLAHPPTPICSVTYATACSIVQCASLVEARGTRVCTAECRDALLAFRAARCYTHLSQSQRLQPRNDVPLHPHAGNALTLRALQGTWYGLYPASGIELVSHGHRVPSRVR